MKKGYRYAAALFAACCMSILLAVSAQADAGIAKLVQTAKAATGEVGEITVTTANKFPQGVQDIYFEISGLAADQNYNCIIHDQATQTTLTSDVIKIGDTYGYTSCYASEYAAGEYTFVLSVENDDSTVCYDDISFNIEICDSLPDTDKGVTFEQTTVGEGEEQFSFDFNALADYEGMHMKLLGKDGKVYAATADTINSYSISLPDHRYDNIFSREELRNNMLRDAYANSGYLYFAATLNEGMYDIAVYDGETRLLTIENAVNVTQEPIVAIYNYPQYRPSAEDGDTEFYLDADLTNIDPKDVSIRVYDEADALVAQSTDWLCTSVMTISQCYTVKMQTVEGISLQNGVNYRIEAVSDLDFVLSGEQDNTLWASPNSTRITNVTVPDARLANFVIRTRNTITDVNYKFELEHSGSLLASAYQFSNDDGTFDIEFLDENENVIRLENGSRYAVRLIQYDEHRGDWSSWGERHYYTAHYNEAAETALQSFSDMTGGAYLGGKQMTAYVFLDPTTADTYQNELFTVQAMNIDGTVKTMTALPFTRKTLDDGRIYLYAKFDVTDTMSYGSYQVSLLYNGELVSRQEYYDALSPLPQVSYSQASLKTIQGRGRFYVEPAEPITEVKLLLFDENGLSTTPDYTLPLELLYDDCYAVPTNQHNIFKKYFYQVSVNGKILNAQFYEGVYIIPDAFEISEETYTVTGERAEHGAVTVSQNTAMLGDMIYVTIVPDEGYEYTPNSVTVNGMPTDGRSFMIQGNSVVTAGFREVRKQTYFVEIDNTYNGSISVEKERYGEGETVQVTAIADRGYRLARLYYRNLRTWESTEISLDTCTFVMPAYQIQIVAEFEVEYPYYASPDSCGFNIILNQGEDVFYRGDTVKISLRSASGAEIDTAEIKQAYYKTSSGKKVLIEKDTFTMPGEDITVYCTLKTYPIQIAYTGYGRIEVWSNYYEQSADDSGWTYVEGKTYCGDTVRVSAYTVGSFVLDGKKPKLDGVPLENWEFIMPNKGVTVSAEFKSETFRRITPEESENGSLEVDATYIYTDTTESNVMGADIGERVILRPEAEPGYRLQSIFINGAELPYDEDYEAYSFIMSDTNVVLRAVFVENTYKVTYKNYDGTVLYEEIVPSGADAEYPGTTPVRPSEGETVFVFTGWSDSLTGISADIEVVAQFRAMTCVKIGSEAELERIRENRDGYYVLTADITLTKPWVPIGGRTIGTADAFTGIFDGDGHTISNVVIEAVNDTNGTNEVSGFFAHIQDAEVKNLGLEIQFGGEGDYHSTETRIGGLAGTATNSVVTRCYIKGTIQSAASYNNVIGGLIGDAQDTTLSDCFAVAEMTATGNFPKVGGLVGTAGGGRIKNCYSAGSIVLSGTPTEPIVGGLIGEKYYVMQAPDIQNSYYCSDTYTQADNGYGSARTALELKRCDTFTDFSVSAPKTAYLWDFDNTWVIDKKQNDGLPMLRFAETETELTVTDTLHRPNVNLLEVELDLSQWVKGDIIFAGFKGGKLVSVDTEYNYAENGMFTDGGWHKFYYEGEMPELVKVMVWKGLGSMTPLCEIAEINMSSVRTDEAESAK